MATSVAPLAATIAEAAESLRCSPATVRRLIDRGELRAVTLGDTTSVRVPLIEIERLLGLAPREVNADA